MNIHCKDWSIQQDYVKNDVVKQEYIDGVFSLDVNSVTGSIVSASRNFTKSKINQSPIALRKTAGYIAEAYVRLSNEFDESLDYSFLVLNPYRQTFLSQDQKSETLNKVTSLGVTEGQGVNNLFHEQSTGIGFFMLYMNVYGELIDINEINLEKHYGLYSTNQIDHNQWSKIKFHITHDHAPESAHSFNIYYCNFTGIELDQRDIKIKHSNPFFYCLQSHESNGANEPSLLEGKEYWTQDFQWRPSYGSRAQFSAKVDSMKMGDANTYKALNHINGIGARFNLNFENLNEREAKSIIHFLQHKAEIDSSFYDFNSSGDKEEHEISEFDYDFFFPYKTLNVFCKDFNHSVKFDNLHNISAVFESRQSILYNTVSFNGYNERTDVKIVLEIEAGQQRNGLFYYEFKEGENSIAQGEDGCEFLDVRTGACASISKLDSNGKRRKILLPNYRIIYLNENLSSADYSIDYVSDREFTLYSKTNTIEILIPSPCINSSIFIKDSHDTTFFSYLSLRDFKFAPSHVFEIPQSPEVKKAGIDNLYDPDYKFGINANNNFTLNLVFSERNEDEAKSILLFLEGHLGHKSFRFSLPDPYGKGAKQRFFYCPEWSHEYVYKDNHTITAKFIECINSQKEDLSLIENYLSYDPTV